MKAKLVSDFHVEFWNYMVVRQVPAATTGPRTRCCAGDMGTFDGGRFNAAVMVRKPLFI
ncbi:hypothetical protein GSbR_41760 [Geobacter sp. SVR]|nr:hypothetical protein GSVR_24010 [Geobacter sp. SVR]GCF87576.1 hypothetical protein GSbR_41760 [Geobacter sp. SVR]